MLIKRSSKNQIAIPKAVLDRAGLGADDVYFDIAYEDGKIVLVPMHMEEKISAEALEAFESEALKPDAADKTYHSMGEAIRGLRRRPSR